MGKGVNSKYIVSSELMSSKREFVIIFRMGTFALEIDFRILQIEMCYWFLTFSNYPSVKVLIQSLFNIKDDYYTIHAGQYSMATHSRVFDLCLYF